MIPLRFTPPRPLSPPLIPSYPLSSPLVPYYPLLSPIIPYYPLASPTLPLPPTPGPGASSSARAAELEAGLDGLKRAVTQAEARKKSEETALEEVTR